MGAIDPTELASPYRQALVSTGTSYLQRVADDKKIPPTLPMATSSVSDVLGAAFRQNNVIGSYLGYQAEQSDFGDFDPTFSPRKQARIDGLGEYVDLFNNAKNKNEYDSLKNRALKEKRDRQVLAENGWGGMLASIGAGTVADPTFWASMFVAPNLGMAKAASTAGRFGVRAGRGAAEAALSEVPLQATQDLRTNAETALSLVGGALTMGVIGTAIDKIALKKQRAVQQEIETLIKSDEAFSGVFGGGSAGAAMVAGTKFADPTANELVENIAFKGVSSVTEKLNVEGIGMTTARSAYEDIRTAGEQLMGDVFIRKGMEEGRANALSADVLKGLQQADVAEAARAVDSGLKALDSLTSVTDAERQAVFQQLRLAGMPLKSADDVTPELIQANFTTLISYALRHGDTHAVQSVEAAAQAFRKIFDRDYDKAISLGFKLPPKETLPGGGTFFARVFDRELVQANQGSFIELIEPYVRASLEREIARGNPDAIDPYRAPDIASAIVGSILGENKGGFVKASAGTVTQIMEDLAAKGYGHLADRVLDIPDDVLAPYLVNDAMAVMQRYKSSIAPQLALKEATGFSRWEDFKVERIDKPLQLLRADLAKSKIPNATKAEDIATNTAIEKEINDATAEFKKATKALEVAWRRIEGRATQAADTDLGTNAQQGIRALRKLVNPVMLGGQVISSLPDAARAAMTHGVAPLMKAAGLRNFTSEFKQLSQESAHRVGVGMETLMNRWQAQGRAALGEGMGDGELLSPATRGWATTHRGLDKLNNTFQKWIGANWWNDMPRQVVAINAENRILTNAAKGWNQLDKKEKTYLLKMGIDESTLGRIKAAAHDAGNVKNTEGFLTSDAMSWADENAATLYRAAIYKDSTTSINAPSVGMLPDWADHDVARVALQFKSFLFAGLQQTLLVGLQQNDARAYLSLMGMIAIGTGIEVARTKILGGREPDKDYTVGELVYKGIDRSGVLGAPLELANMLNNLSGTAFGYNFMPYDSHRQKEKTIEASFGAVPSYVGQAFRFTRNLIDQDKSTEDLVREGSRLLPFQNAIGLRPYNVIIDGFYGQTQYLDNLVDGFKKTFTGLDWIADPDLSFSTD